MSDDRDPSTGGFDADEWFRRQFGATEPPPLVEPPESLPVMLPPPAPAVLEPTQPSEAIELEPAQPSEIIELEPTQPSEIIELEPTQPSEVVPSSPGVLGDAATELLRQPEEGGALDELFNTESFQEYDEGLIPAATRSSRRAVAGSATGGGAPGGADSGAPEGEGSARAPLTRTQKTLLWVAGSLVAILALVAVFVLGTRIPLALGPAPGAGPAASGTPSPSPTPTTTERPVGPVAPGDYAWDDLWGGECLEPFVDAWQEEYTVVDCAEPHTAQLFDRAPFPRPEGSEVQGPFPGEEALAAQISLLCGRPGVLDLSAAAQFVDIQVQGAYAVNEQQWDEGMQDFFCFVSRSSGEPLTGSLVPAS